MPSGRPFGSLGASTIQAGDTFTRLTALHAGTVTRKIECRCTCGEIVKVLGNNLSIGNTQSCGCLKKDRVKERR